MQDVTTETFDQEVIQNDDPVIVLWGSKSNPLANRFALILHKNPPKNTKIVRIEIDDNPELVMQYSIRFSPLLMLFMDGLVFVESRNFESFLENIKEWIAL